MTRDELLEAAALAGGIKWGSDKYKDSITYHGHAGVWIDEGRFWNPMHNSADAFELAMKLSLVVIREHDFVRVHSAYFMNTTNESYCGSDEYLVAARLAITKAAAKIGSRLGYKRIERET